MCSFVGFVLGFRMDPENRSLCSSWFYTVNEQNKGRTLSTKKGTRVLGLVTGVRYM